MGRRFGEKTSSETAVEEWVVLPPDRKPSEEGFTQISQTASTWLHPGEKTRCWRRLGGRAWRGYSGVSACTPLVMKAGDMWVFSWTEMGLIGESPIWGYFESCPKESPEGKNDAQQKVAVSLPWMLRAEGGDSSNCPKWRSVHLGRENCSSEGPSTESLKNPWKHHIDQGTERAISQAPPRCDSCNQLLGPVSTNHQPGRICLPLSPILPTWV